MALVDQTGISRRTALRTAGIALFGVVGPVRAQPAGRTELTTVDIDPAGSEPADVAATGRGFVVVANSRSDDLISYRLDRRGNLNRIDRDPARRGPSAIAIDRRGVVLLTNQDSNEITSYRIDRRGNLNRIDRDPVNGTGPLAVDVSSDGLVAVANAGSNEVCGFGLDRRGRLEFLGSEPAGFFPRAVAFVPGGRELFVATATGQIGDENRILRLHLDHRGFLRRDSVGAGFGLTDIAVGSRHVFAASATAQGEDQLLAFDRRGARLDRSGRERFGTGFSLRNLAVARERGTEYVLVTSFNRDEIRSIRVD
jgi:6-phosphogluconolactonase (cycloisomerase 2 family)